MKYLFRPVLPSYCAILRMLVWPYWGLASQQVTASYMLRSWAAVSVTESPPLLDSANEETLSRKLL